MRKRHWIAAAVWFAVWHLVLLYKVWADPTHLVNGHVGDNTVMLWNLAWVRYALDHGNLGFWCPKAYYPDGFLFLYGTHTWLDGVLGWVASSVLPAGPRGIILWANMVQLLASTATGLLAMLTLRHWGVRRISIQLLAASAVTFSAFRIYASTGHYHFFGTHWMLAAVYAAAFSRRLLRAGRRPGFCWAAAAGLLTGVAFLNDQTHAVFAAILLSLTFVSLALSPQSQSQLRNWKAGVLSMCIAGAGTLIVAAIHLAPIASAIHAGRFTYQVPRQAERLVDASSVFLPPDGHPLLGHWVSLLRDREKLEVVEGPYLGVAGYAFLLLSAVVTLLAIRPGPARQRRTYRTAAFAAMAAGIFLTFALGEQLQIGAERYILMPGRALREIPVLNNIRLLQRWIWPTHLCLGLAGALSLQLLWYRGPSRYFSPLLWLAAFLVCIEGFRVGAPVTDITRDPTITSPRLVRQMQLSYKGGGVLTMPVEGAYAQAHIQQFHTDFLINTTIAYTARPPFGPESAPWRGTKWTPETADWLRQRDVRMVIFPMQPTKNQFIATNYMDWVRNARAAVPGLVALDYHGRTVE